MYVLKAILLKDKSDHCMEGGWMKLKQGKTGKEEWRPCRHKVMRARQRAQMWHCKGGLERFRRKIWIHLEFCLHYKSYTVGRWVSLFEELKLFPQDIKVTLIKRVSGSSVIYKTFFALNIKNSTNPRDLSIYILNKLEGPCPNFNDILPLVLLNKNMNSFSLQMAETFLSINRKKEYYFINIYKHIFIYKHKKYIHSIKSIIHFLPLKQPFEVCSLLLL
jgi:hypothetical protein